MVREKGIFEVLKLGLNLNGDLEDKKLVRIAKKCERLGVLVWIGDNELFKDPFYVADLIGDVVSNIGFGVVSVRRGCKAILDGISSLAKSFKDTNFLLGIGAGNVDDPKKALRHVLSCLEFLRNRLEIPIFCGCSGPVITSKASKIVDGILFNYGYPDYVKWISNFVRDEIYRVAYAPALVLPSDFEEDLLIACSIVACSNQTFVRVFGYEGLCKVLRNLDFKELIINRKLGKKLDPRILDFRDLLVERFAIAGDLSSVCDRVRDLLRLCDHVVLGDPFFRDDRSVEITKSIKRELMDLNHETA